MLARKIKCCVSCGKDRVIYAKKMCGNCYQYDYQKRLRAKVASKPKGLSYESLQSFYKEYWETNKDRKCHECGTPIYSFKSWHIHHIAKKSKYPELALNQDVCVYLCLLCHSQAHSTSSKNYPNQLPNCWSKYLDLKEKHNIKLFI